MKHKTLRIDLLSDWQKHFAFGLGEVILSEKDSDENIITELVLATNAFDLIMNLDNDFLHHSSESTVYRYNYSRVYDMIGWASEKEEQIIDIIEFYDYLINNENQVDINLFGKEYDEIINICKSVMENENKLYLTADNY